MESAVNLSLLYLRSRVPALPDNAEEVAARLRGLGFEVDRTVPLAELLRPIVVARVESLSQHPNADRLMVCVVNDGGEQTLQIVTGAGNVQAGAYYPLVRTGTTLPNGTKIKKGKLRGELSEGMLGSADELELGTDHDGLLTLQGEPAPGTPLPDVIAVEGTVFVITGTSDAGEVVEALEAGKRREPAPEA